MLEGSCHCGALTLRFSTTRPIAELPVRACGCTFCLRHRPRYTSDPGGHVTIHAAAPDAASPYRFGLRLADFLVCRTCGAFVAAHEPATPTGPGRAVININALSSAAEFTTAPTLFTAYDTEDAAARTARRARNWTPATLE
jgi:hypothetical protein